MPNNRIPFVSFMHSNETYTLTYLKNLAMQNLTDIKETAESELIIQCGENQDGEPLYRLTNKGIQYRNN